MFKEPDSLLACLLRLIEYLLQVIIFVTLLRSRSCYLISGWLFPVRRTVVAAAAVFDYVQPGFSFQLHCRVSSSVVYLRLLLYERERYVER